MHSNFKDFSILYVEDDEGIRSINFSMFKRIFKKAYEASDGEIGYQLYLKYKPDIIVTDIKMPRMDGIELAKKIRKSDEQTRIIITTAFNDEKYLIEAIELNLERYLVKPITKRNLFPALEKAISHIQKRVVLSKDFYFDLKSSLFYFENSIIKMTKKELLFLALLVKYSDKIITYEEIEEEVWGHEYMSIKSLRTTIGILRKKIPFNIISNISNMGYKLKLDSCIQ